MLITITSKDGFDPTGSQDGTIKKGDSLVFVVDVLEVSRPCRADQQSHGADAAARREGHPTKFVTKPTTPKTVDDARCLRRASEGTGAKVKAGQTITVHYLGQSTPTARSSTSRSARSRRPSRIGTGAVIQGWEDRLSSGRRSDPA